MAKGKKAKRARKRLTPIIERADPPVLAAEVGRKIKSRSPKRGAVPAKVTIRLPMFAASGGSKGLSLRKGAGKRMASVGLASELAVSIPGKSLGQHAFPAAPSAKRFAIDTKETTGRDEITSLEPFAPAHLRLRTKPLKLAASLRAAPLSIRHDRKLGRGEKEPTTLFPPEDRATYSDTSYPWGTVGRLSTGASGVMIGPRHLLTVSHGIPWSGSGVSAFTFSPGTFDGSAPFGVASATWVYYRVKVTGTLNANERKHDYAVVVLNWRIGDLTGWMGSKTYHTSWDGSPYWYHCGYPTDIASGQRPIWDNGISMDGKGVKRHREIHHWADVWPGQSGGPMFAWWSGQAGPHCVSVQSAHDSSRNYASGGSEMVDLVIDARSDFP
jgi:V8-like Glu-specific endopeptidase